MNYPKDFDRHLIKRIEVEQKFADYIYKEFRAKRYGLAPCCSLEQMDKYKIKKELCDWNDLKLKIYSSTTYEELNFYPIPENNPDLFDATTETVTTTTPIITYETTVTVPGEPIWVIDDCVNNCVYPQKFMPTETQLQNINTQIVGGLGSLGMANGRNSMLKFAQSDLEFIPNNNCNTQGCASSEVTIYSKIDYLSYITELTNSPSIQQAFIDYAEAYWPDTDEVADVSLAIYNWYNTGFNAEPAVNAFFQNISMPPLAVFQEYENTGSSFFWIPMAQFTLIPAPGPEGPNTSVKIAFKYIDPTLLDEASGNFGNDNYTTLTIDGETYYTGDNDDFAAITLFGNEIGFKLANNTQDDWYKINGGFYYSYAQSEGNAMMRAVVRDGLDVYQTDYITVNGTIIETGMPDPSIYYTTDPNIGGSYLNSDYVLSGGGNISYDNFYLYQPLYEEGNNDLRLPSCSFNWGVGTVTDGQNIGLNGNIIESGILDTACTYVGMETFEEEVITVTEGGETVTSTVTTYKCKTDNEYIVFKVVNQLGDPVKGYDIIINGGNTGKTNENGIFKTIIENASVKTNHTLNICHCFTTTGACTQKEIKIIVNDDDIENIVIDKIDCTPISPSE
jgi:hypothetical protein